ncbi:3-oxoacyl-ACP synthase [Winogradskyella ursingii]|uniref:3-oxoacyl-ACP synthase n=1 Tax=Winogradskyella ursingii TaxID=2686079 RepID=UPI001FEA5CDE|nr:3-oxoacyl-ACP synthase [Winogradskyella ursingii]
MISLNGNTLFENKSEEFSTLIKSAYKDLDINYPKFFKMDNLSKLAFICADILINNSAKNESNIAIVLSNRASSLDTDRTFQKSISDIENHYPSPSIFVYTLPNICIGEISIKHQLYSENSFFIFDAFSPKELWVYAENLLKTNKAEKVLCGWVDFDENDYEAFLYIVENEGQIHHTINEIDRLYHTQ